MGILIAHTLFKEDVVPSEPFVFLVIVITLLLLVLHVRLKSFKVVFGFLVTLHFLILGATIYLVNHPFTTDTHFSHQSDVSSYVGLVYEVSEQNNRQVVYTNIKLALSGKDSVFVSSGYMMLYNPLENTAIELGDRIQFSANLKKINRNPNPHAFDYARYLFYQKITHSAYLKDEKWCVIESNQMPILLHWASRCRSYCYSVLAKWISNDERLAIVNAMLLGQRNALTVEMKNAFVNTGAIHVLAVSGLHVGILSMIILWMLNIFPSSSFKVRLIKLLIYLCVIWMFALVTGSGPAVLRASLMFSFYFSAQIFSRGSSSFNSLAASAFLILLNDPYQLFSIGFQFSFLAISSILLFMPIIQVYYKRKNVVVRYILNLIVLSCVAQILVAPLSVLYFNQFAVYFILSGLIAVPSAFIILCTSIALIVFDVVLPFINTMVVAPILNCSLDFLLSSVQYIQKLPGAVLENLCIDSVQLVLLTGLLISTTTYFFVARKHWFYIGAFFVAINTYSAIEGMQLDQQKVCFVYNVPRATLVDFFLGDTCVEFSSKALDEKRIEYTAGKNRIKHGIQKIVNKEEHLTNSQFGFFTNSVFFQLGRKRIMLVDDSEDLYSDFGLDIHYLILANDVTVDLEMLLQSYLVHFVIIDSSHSESKQLEYGKVLESLEIEYTFTKNQVIKIHG